MQYQIDYREIYDHAPDMCLSVEAGTGKIIECNQTLLDKLGFSKTEVLAKTVTQMYHPECFLKVKENLKSFSESGKLTHPELLVLKKGGDTIEVSINYTAVRDKKGKILYSNAVLRDIGELKKIQRTLQSEQEKTQSLLLNILPGSIAERLKHNPDSIVDRIANSTTLFCDIEGFTALSGQISPDELLSTLNIVFSEFDLLVDTHGLEKIKTIGDAYMVASGLPLPREDHAEVIAELALDMIQAKGRLNMVLKRPINIRIGIESGPVVAGVIGKKKFSYDLWGDSVNTASRLESQGIPGEVQIGQATYELIKGKFVCDHRGKIEIKGKGMIQAYLLRGRKAN
jgi:adenylate cyclase